MKKVILLIVLSVFLASCVWPTKVAPAIKLCPVNTDQALVVPMRAEDKDGYQQSAFFLNFGKYVSEVKRYVLFGVDSQRQGAIVFMDIKYSGTDLQNAGFT